jgi:hypothetical protein
MANQGVRLLPSWLSSVATTALAVGCVALPYATSFADQGGVSYWIPGTFGSLAATPPPPGWSLTSFNYYTSVMAGADVAAARAITIGKLNPTLNVNFNASYKANQDTVNVNPSYAFATPIFGGELAIGVTAAVGLSTAELNGVLGIGTESFTATRQVSASGSVFGFADVDPIAQLFWNSGVNNWMTYLTGDIPIGTYNSSNLANVGIGHGAIDGGAGYSYLDTKRGHEFSLVTGFTYNLINPSTNYQNGFDWHTDWGLSQYLTKQLFVGAVGYFYDQISADTGAGDHVGAFESRVIGIGPQIGFTTSTGSLQANLNLKAYWEFDAIHRPSGWNTWVTLSLSPNNEVPSGTRSAVVTK